jgi:hypothetical protein
MPPPPELPRPLANLPVARGATDRIQTPLALRAAEARQRRGPPEWALARAPLEEPGFVDWLGEHPREARALIERWYGKDFAADHVGRLDALGPTAWPLLAHPGIASRAGEFARFAAAHLEEHPDATSRTLRQAFSDYLGEVKLFRGMVLEPRRAGALREEGLLSPGARSGERGIGPWLARGRCGPIQEIAAKVLEDDEDQGAVISTSLFREVAEAAGSYRLGRKAGQRPYLLTLEVPLLSTVWEDGAIGRMSTAAELSAARDAGPVLNISIGDDNYHCDWASGGVEVSLFHFVPASALVAVEEICDPKPVRIDPWTRALGGTGLEPPRRPRRRFEDREDP